MNYEEVLATLKKCGTFVTVEDILMDFHGETYHNGYIVNIDDDAHNRVSLYIDADNKEELASKLSEAMKGFSQKLIELSKAVKTNEKEQTYDKSDSR